MATWSLARRQKRPHKPRSKPLPNAWLGGSPTTLASQLPPQLAEYMRYEREETSNPFSLAEFFERVNERDEGVDQPRAVYHARVVMEVLQEAATQGEMDDVRSQLPDEYAPLVEAGSQGEVHLTRSICREEGKGG